MKHVVVYTKTEQWKFDCESWEVNGAYLVIEGVAENGVATRDRVIFPHSSYEFARLS